MWDWPQILSWIPGTAPACDRVCSPLGCPDLSIFRPLHWVLQVIPTGCWSVPTMSISSTNFYLPLPRSQCSLYWKIQGDNGENKILTESPFMALNSMKGGQWTRDKVPLVFTSTYILNLGTKLNEPQKDGRKEGYQFLWNKIPGTGGTAQWLRGLGFLVEGPGLVPSTHLAAHNCPPVPGILTVSSGFWGLYTNMVHIHVGKILIHIKKKKRISE